MTGTRYDAVIVGTGFGGAITGARLAEGGMRVLLLERGPWWGPASNDRAPSVGRDFPRGAWGSRKLVRNIRHANARRSREWRINSDGLYEIHRFPQLTVLGASGVGGGSHTYAGIQAEPAPDYWTAFPAEITPTAMAPYTARVRAMQHPAPAPAQPRQRTLGRAMSTAGMVLESADLAIDHDTCVRCGGCVLGCPHGAKTTLDLTYLPAALRAGAEIWPLCEVARIGTHHNGYTVDAVDLRTATAVTVHAERLVLAAGTLNTLRLLFAARDRDRTLTRVSRRLGHRFSSNADYPLVVRRSRPNEPSTGTLVNTTARTAAAYYVDADIPLRVKNFQLMIGMAAEDSPATVRAVPGGVTSDASRKRSAEVYNRMDSEMRKTVRASGFLQTVSAPRRLVSAHPLGGAALAATRFDGVVSHTGEVFGHPRLYVADGSTLPTAPGVPPSLTIAALAERHAELMLQDG